MRPGLFDSSKQRRSRMANDIFGGQAVAREERGANTAFERQTMIAPGKFLVECLQQRARHGAHIDAARQGRKQDRKLDSRGPRDNRRLTFGCIRPGTDGAGGGRKTFGALQRQILRRFDAQQFGNAPQILYADHEQSARQTGFWRRLNRRPQVALKAGGIGQTGRGVEIREAFDPADRTVQSAHHAIEGTRQRSEFVVGLNFDAPGQMG